MPGAPLYIGIDAGGTKTALCARSSKNEPATLLDGPGTNLRRDGLSHTVSSLVRLIHELAQLYKKDSDLHIYAGIAGAGHASDHEAVRNKLALALNLPLPSIQIHADASIAYYAAHKDRSGILVITGTGSIIWARTKTGQMVRAGGWGSLLGDEGGGFQIGLAALRALAHEMDGGPSTALSNLLCNHYGLCNPSDILDFTYKEKANIPSLAPFVLEAAAQSDEVAIKIVEHQVNALAQSLKFLILSHPHISPKLVYMGGLTKNLFYVESLQKGLLAVYPDLSLSQLTTTPAEAALLLACKMKS